MHIAVLGSSQSWYLKDLIRAAGSAHRISCATFHDLRSAIGPAGRSVTAGAMDLGEVDCVLVRTMAPGSLEQVVFRMDALAQLEATGTLVLNPPRSIEAAVDKYLATARLEAAGLLVPQTIACQTVDHVMEAFETLGGDVVVKPLFGSEGRGIARLTDEALALRAAKMLTGLGAVVYLQRFIEHEGFDMRLLVVGEQVFGMRRRNPADWRTNVSRGATTERLELTREMEDLAHRAATAIGAPLAGVDVLPAKDGRWYTLEVNAVPGWKALARTLDIDIAERVLGYIDSAGSHRTSGERPARRNLSGERPA